MPYYRVFTLGRDNHFDGVEIIECETDREALDKAPSVMGIKERAEIWQADRPIGRIGLP